MAMINETDETAMKNVRDAVFSARVIISDALQQLDGSNRFLNKTCRQFKELDDALAEILFKADKYAA